eukprot:4695739-Prorocentrum_lima.AAC.1
MTSSLVGSEMCIRDRCCMAVASIRVHAVPRSRGWHRVTMRDRQSENQPVSYTHLTLPTICSV